MGRHRPYLSAWVEALARVAFGQFLRKLRAEGVGGAGGNHACNHLLDLGHLAQGLLISFNSLTCKPFKFKMTEFFQAHPSPTV